MKSRDDNIRGKNGELPRWMEIAIDSPIRQTVVAQFQLPQMSVTVQQGASLLSPWMGLEI